MRFCLTILAVIGISSAASAFQIRNLDDFSHRVDVMQGGTHVTSYDIPAGGKERIIGHARVKLSGQPESAYRRAFYVDTFIIWDNGELHRQMRQKGRAH